MLYDFEIKEKIDEGEKYWISKSYCIEGCIGKGDTPERAMDDFEKKAREMNKVVK